MILKNSINGINVYELEQGSETWAWCRAGSITASRAHDIIKSGRAKGSYSEARKTYMIELIAQVCTGLVSDSVKFKQAEYGHEHEPLARSAYEAQKFEIVETCGLVYKDESMRCAVSPDGLTDVKGLEIKCPFTTAVHIDTLMNGLIKPEYHTQMQFCMWVTGYKGWDFCSFDPRMRGSVDNRLFIQEFLPDNELFDKFEVEIPKFITEMDEVLDKLGFKFGDQWRDILS